jgi:hypothetical protein
MQTEHVHNININMEHSKLSLIILKWTELWVDNFLFSNGRPYGRDIQDGLTDRMIHQRHMSWLFVIPAGGVSLIL